jgi:hypothetical protein
VALGYAGAAATGLQCINGLYRLYDLVENGGEDVAWLDSQGGITPPLPRSILSRWQALAAY